MGRHYGRHGFDALNRRGSRLCSGANRFIHFGLRTRHLKHKAYRTFINGQRLNQPGSDNICACWRIYIFQCRQYRIAISHI